MSEEFFGILDGKDGQTHTKLRIRLNADSGDIIVGERVAAETFRFRTTLPSLEFV